MTKTHWPGRRARDIMNRELASQDAYGGGATILLKRLWQDYLSVYRLHLVLALLSASVGAGVGLCFPLTLRFLFDKVILSGPVKTPEEMSSRLHAGLLYLAMNCGIWAVYLGCQWLQNRLIQSAGRKLVFDLRKDLNARLHNLHIGYFVKTPNGRIMSRVLDDVDIIRRWVSGKLLELFGGTTRLLVGTILAFTINWRIALIVFMVLPVYFATIYMLRPLVRRANITLRRLNSAMYARAGERIGGVQIIRAFAREPGELSGFASIVHDYVRVGNRLAVYNQGMSLVAGSITAVVTGIVIFFAGTSVRLGQISIGSMIAMHRLLNHMFDPIQSLATIVIQFQAFLVVVQRVFSLLDEKADIAEGSEAVTSLAWPLRLHEVSLQYPQQDYPAIKNFSLSINRGERIALMGPSGSGKSSLFMLLMRFYDPTSGTIHWAGNDLRKLRSTDLRRHLCMVQQEPFIFNGTIKANISYGHPQATPDQIEEATRLAELHEFIMSLPNGYDSEVGEKGISLSGGQKQRLSLAAALLTSPQMLLLDDVTSALDSQTELRIRQTIRKTLVGKTSLIITQRIVMAADCDRIVVMNEGSVAAIGTHDTLKHQDGFYRTICERQGWL